MPEKNQVYTAEITSLTNEGSGVCRIDGMAVFVPGTAAGDVAEIKVVKVLSHYAFGILQKIITPSPDRIENDCPVFKQCGGCVFRHISYDAEVRAKDDIVRDAFRRIGGLDPVFDEFISADQTDRYRNKGQFPLAKVDGNAVCGFFAPRSHRVIPIGDCQLQPEVFSNIVKTALEFINNKGISVYEEKSHTGILRHIYLRQGTHSKQIMVCFVVRKDISRQLRPVCSLLTKKFPDIKSIVMNINPEKTNVIIGNNWITLSGSDVISDIMCGNTISISPAAFYQVNTVQAEKMYAKALEYASPSPDDVIADLYCGAGTIGISMADKVKTLVGIEIVPEAIKNAKENAAANNISNAQFYCGDAGEVFEKLRNNGCSPRIVLLDPPRKGCSPDTLKAIVSARPYKIVMISCNPSTAARDAKFLSENGYSVRKVCGADFFPRTRHVECVVLMSRKK